MEAARATFARSVRRMIENEELEDYSIRFSTRGLIRVAYLLVHHVDRTKIMNLLIAQEQEKFPEVDSLEIQEGPADVLLCIIGCK